MRTCRDCHGQGWTGPDLDGFADPCPRCNETGVEGIR